MNMTPEAIVFLLLFFVFFVIHVAFAIGAYVDGRYMLEQKRGPFLVAPFIWALSILVGGIPVVVAYWAIHHSTLRPRPTSDSAPLN